MNPFDWSGPEFLGFYFVLTAVATVLAWWRTRGPAESHATLAFMTTDPYRIACLREGEKEAIRVAIFNLVDRGLLDNSKEWLRTIREDATELVRRPLDRAILSACLDVSTIRAVQSNTTVQQAAADYSKELAEQRLFIDESERESREGLFFVTVGLLLGVSLVKILIALGREDSNILFLMGLSAVAFYTLEGVFRRERTSAGRAMLTNLKSLTQRLRLRSSTLQPGGLTNEALLLASVYGLRVLPPATFPVVTQILLYPQQRGDGGDSNPDSGGSGCGGGCGGCGG